MDNHLPSCYVFQLITATPLALYYPVVVIVFQHFDGLLLLESCLVFSISLHNFPYFNACVCVYFFYFVIGDMSPGVVVVVGICNCSQMRTSKYTCLIFGVSIVLDPG